MSIETRHLNQTITHWPVTGSDGYDGFTFGAAVTISSRWEERSELFIAPNGEEETSNVIAYTASDIAIGDFIALTDLTATADPTTIDNTYRVRQKSKITDLRALNTIRKVYL